MTATNFRLDVYHHFDQPGASPALAAALQRIEGKLDLMTTFSEQVIEQLGQINTVTTEIADDQADLIERLAANPSDAEKEQILADLQATRDRLTTVAAGYTPVPVAEGETPGETPVQPDTDSGSSDGSEGVPA